MKKLKDLLYTKSHEWVEFLDESTVRVGLTDFAQHALGDIVFVNLPGAGDAVTAGESFADAESVKAVSDIFSPVTGEVSAVNDVVLDNPQEINSDPYGAWLVEVRGVTAKEELIDLDAYEKLCSEEEA